MSSDPTIPFERTQANPHTGRPLVDHILGADVARPLDAAFVNSPLKNYDEQARHNDFTLPVLGLGYIATGASHAGLNVGVLDCESLGLGLSAAAAIINEMSPRWAWLLSWVKSTCASTCPASCGGWTRSH